MQGIRPGRLLRLGVVEVVGVVCGRPHSLPVACRGGRYTHRQRRRIKCAARGRGLRRGRGGTAGGGGIGGRACLRRVLGRGLVGVAAVRGGAARVAVGLVVDLLAFRGGRAVGGGGRGAGRGRGWRAGHGSRARVRAPASGATTGLAKPKSRDRLPCRMRRLFHRRHHHPPPARPGAPPRTAQRAAPSFARRLFILYFSASHDIGASPGL